MLEDRGSRGRSAAGLIAVALLAGGLAVAQPGEYLGTDREGVPMWELDTENPEDVFTFVRIKYSSFRRGWGWWTDFPASDLYLSFRLQQLTSLKVNPWPKVLELTDPALPRLSLHLHHRARPDVALR